MGQEKEIRSALFPIEITGETEDKRIVEGYALLFDTPSDGLPFEEVIMRGALDGVIENSDVFAYLNHEEYRGVLARSKYGKGSLTLIVDNVGLKYRFVAPRTALGDALLENIRRGEIYESSFSFYTEKDEWEQRSDGTWKRTILKIKTICDVAPVYNAAYSKTSVGIRSRQQAEEELKKHEQEHLKSYFQNMEQLLNI